jgi:hypothetical protein
MTLRRSLAVLFAAAFAVALAVPPAAADGVKVAGKTATAKAKTKKTSRRRTKREESKYKTRLLSENSSHTYFYRDDGAPDKPKKKAKASRAKTAKKKSGDEFSLFGPDDGLDSPSDRQPACSTQSACTDADSL